VALLWQGLFAQSIGATLRAPHALVLGASVWLAYVADRWIEGWRLTQVCTERHFFYQRRRWPVAVVWLAVLISDVSVALGNLRAPELGAGLLLLAFVLLYLFSHQLIHRHHGWRAPKEICVAVLMGGGVALFPLLQSSVLRGPAIPPLVLFMLLCFVNCVLISAWECEVDERQGQTSIALQFRRGAAFSTVAPWALAGLATVVLAIDGHEPTRTAFACAIASSVLLGAIDVLEGHWGRRLARVLADVALMSPVAPLLWSWLR